MHPPLVINLGRVAAKIAGVPEIDLLAKGILRGKDLDGPAVAFLRDLEDVQGHCAAGAGIVVLGQGHVDRCAGVSLQEPRVGH